MSSTAPAAAAVDDTAGPAHVATVSFLASRAVPSGGFWVALAGGVALARVAQRGGARQGYGASVAAMLETVALMGPTRFGVPFTQALSAPLLGVLEARGWRPAAQVLVCTALRVLTNAVGVAFFIWVIAGGLDAYAGTYDALARRVGLSLSEAGSLVLTALGLLGWGVFASVVQVGVYRRGLAAWAPEPGEGNPVPEPVDEPHRGRFDPRAVTVAAAVAFGLLLASREWLLLGAVAAWLAIVSALAKPDRRAVPTGLALAGILAFGAFVFTLGGGLGLEEALRRASRAALLVLVATWLRAAAGAEGLREVFRRMLGRLRRLPAAPEAARTLGAIGSEGRLLAAGQSLVDSLRSVPFKAVPVMDAVLGWVTRESGRFRPGAPVAPPTLRVRAVDAVLLAAACAPGAALLA